MKKIYLLLLTFSLFSFCFAQSPIVTIDRDNITGPTTTGNAANISSIGLIRGSGIGSGNGTDFSTKNWNENSQVNADIANEYIQWSVSATTNFDIDITDLDIRLLRNNNGPQDWQVFYSLDGFATAGISVTTPQTATTTETNYSFSSLVINSGDAGTITFRLYAWNANNNGGTLTIAGEPLWTDFGITDPGVRLSGNVNSTPLNSTESNIIISGFNPTDNIDYSLYNASSGLTTTNAIKIGEFSIQDGGDDLIDADALATILTDLEFTVTGNTNITALALFDGATNLSETSIINSTTIFNSINSGVGISAPDGGTKLFEVYATFNTTVTDNDQLQLIISSASANGIMGSSFATLDAGGTQTPISGDDNRIEVTASRLAFDIQPSDVSIFSIMTPAPTVLTTDINANTDLDFSGTIILSSTSSTFDPSATISVITVAGVATFDNLIFSTTSVSDSLIAVSLNGLNFTISNAYEIFGFRITIANQDFDGSLPDWSYTTDVPFFDNGWGIDGYYGIIDINSALPLNYSRFSQNILGSNDLNDEGSGTAGLATTTFSTVDIAAYTNVELSFDWDINGYGNNDTAQYEVFYDGLGQGIVDIINGGTDDEGSINIIIPDNVNTISLQLSIGNNGEAAFTGFDNFLVSSTFDGLIYYSNTWRPSAPSNGTGGLNALVLDGTYTINSDVAINNIIIDDAGNMAIDKGKSLLVNGELVCNDNVILDSDSLEYSSLIVFGNVVGSVTYSRHANTNSGGNDLISAPVTGETFGSFASNNSNIFENPSNSTEKLFGPFDKTSGTYLTYDIAIPAEASVTLDAGIGYRAASSDGLNFSFNGNVNTGNINVPIVISGPNAAEWNLIGNPYPSYIKLSDFLAANNAQFDPTSSGIYGYDGNASDGWEIWNQAYSDANPDAALTPGQGFLVSSALASGTIAFTPVMRSTGTSDDFIPGRMQNPLISHLELSLNSASQVYKTNFYFTDNASLGLDSGYDAEVFGGSAPEFALYTHLVEESNGNDIAIQSLSQAALTDVTIPLGINVIQGQQVTVSITNTTLPSTTEVYLEDSLTNTLTLLNNSDYTFTAASTLTEIGRFFIHYTEQSLSNIESELNSLQIYTTITPKSLFIKGQLTSNTEIRLYDIQGRLVLNTFLDSSRNSNQIDVSNLGTGVYVVQLSNNSLNKTQKVIIK